MRKFSILAISIVALSCSKSKNFSDIKVGMKESEVKDLVGEPDEQTEFFGAKIYIYKDGETGHMVTIVSDTVAGYKGGEELANDLKEMAKGFEDLEKTMDSIN